MKLYHRANEGRRNAHDPDVNPRRMKFFRAALKNFALLQLLFLLFVDYDGGAIGQSFLNAYNELKGSESPTLMQQKASVYPNVPDSLVSEVCRAAAWGALYIAPGASDRLHTALSSVSAAGNYNASSAVYYIWNEARYAPIIDEAVSVNLNLLSVKATGAWSSLANLQRNFSAHSPELLNVLITPWELSSINLKPTVQGSRLIYNTIAIILIFVQEFFYLGTINGLYGRFNLFPSLRPRRIIAYRTLISGAYTFVGSLCTTSMIWAFKAGWAEDGTQFVLNWMILWLFAHLNFLTFDVFTVWLPPPYVPMAMITWLMININSVLLPFELSPGFYRWGYALPAHEAFQVLLDIWSGGCNPQLRYALPVLFAWETFGFTLSALGIYRRCHYAYIAQEKAHKPDEEELAAALADKQSTRQEHDTAVHRNGQSQSVFQGQEGHCIGEVDGGHDRNMNIDYERTKVYERAPSGLSFPLAFPEN